MSGATRAPLGDGSDCGFLTRTGHAGAIPTAWIFQSLVVSLRIQGEKDRTTACRRCGCPIVALHSDMLLGVGPKEWLTELLAMIADMLTGILPLTMAVCILAIWLLRQAT